MDIRKIKKLIELLEESGVSEIEIREGEESVRIARNGPAEALASASRPQAATNTPSSAAASAPTSASMRSASARASAEAPPAVPTAGEGEHLVTAPMVGTYYSAPSPGAKQFVEIGDEVQVGQVLRLALGGRRVGRGIARDAHRFLALPDLDLRDTGFLEQLDQFFYLSNVHRWMRSR